VFLAPSRSDLGESLLITTLLGIPLGEPNGKTPTHPHSVAHPHGVCLHVGAAATLFLGIFLLK